MLDALVTLKDATYLGAVQAGTLLLRGEPLKVAQIAALKLWAGDLSSNVTLIDGSEHPLYEKRKLGRPRLLLAGQVTMTNSAHDGNLDIDVAKVTYMTLNRVG